MNSIRILRSCGKTAVLLLCTIVFFGIYASVQAQEFFGASKRFDLLIESFATKYSVDPLLVKALVWRESKFQPRATGSQGEIGLMQIKMAVVSDWAEINGREMPDREAVYDPYLNLEIGIWHLARALRNWDGNSRRYELALCEYNAGRRKLLRWIAHNDGSYAQTLKTCASAEYVTAITGKFMEYSVQTTTRMLAAAGLADVKTDI